MAKTLELLGIKESGFEGMCTAFQVSGEYKVITIWSTSDETCLAMDELNGVGSGLSRSTISLLDLLETLGGVSSVELLSAFEGVFVFDVTSASGHTVEVSSADAVTIARHFDVKPEVEDELAGQIAVYASPADLQEYLDFTYITPVNETDAEGFGFEPNSESSAEESLADEDFASLMRNLGVDDSDLGGGGNAGENE